MVAGLHSAQPVLSRYLVSDPLRFCVLLVLVLPLDVSHLSVGISLLGFVVRTFVRNALSLGSGPWSSPPSPLRFHLTPVKCHLCFNVCVEQEEQSWALLVLLMRLSDECLHRLKVLQSVLNPVLSYIDQVPAGTAAVDRGYSRLWSGCRVSVLFSPNLLQLVLVLSFLILL